MAAAPDGSRVQFSRSTFPRTVKPDSSNLPARAGYLVIWEFHVRSDSAPDFEQIYGPDGAWAQLFRRGPDYLGTQLLRDLTQPNRYLTLDRWTSRDALHQFKQDHHAEYAALDQQCETLTENESLLGEFEPSGS